MNYRYCCWSHQSQLRELMTGQCLVLGGSIDEGIVSAAGGHAGQQLSGDIGSQRWRACLLMMVRRSEVVISPNRLRRSSLDAL